MRLLTGRRDKKGSQRRKSITGPVSIWSMNWGRRRNLRNSRVRLNFTPRSPKKRIYQKKWKNGIHLPLLPFCLTIFANCGKHFAIECEANSLVFINLSEMQGMNPNWHRICFFRTRGEDVLNTGHSESHFSDNRNALFYKKDLRYKIAFGRWKKREKIPLRWDHRVVGRPSICLNRLC